MNRSQFGQLGVMLLNTAPALACPARSDPAVSAVGRRPSYKPQ